MNRQLLLVTTIIAIFFLSSCGPTSSAEAASDSQAKYIENKGSDTIVNLALAWAEKYQDEHPNVRISVTGGGSGTGIASLINGTVDIANASRQIKQEEIDQAESNGVEPVEHIIARDAIAVIVNPENPVSQLTLKQISDIYSGKITNWKDVGGPNQKIKVMTREGKISGVGRMVRELLFKDPEHEFPAEAAVFKSSGPLEKAVENEPWTIGFTGISSAKKRSVKMVSIDGKEPSYENIASGKYMLYRPLYLTISQNPRPEIRKFVAFILSDEGQAIIKKEGTVTLKDGSSLWAIYNSAMKEAGIAKGTF